MIYKDSEEVSIINKNLVTKKNIGKKNINIKVSFNLKQNIFNKIFEKKGLNKINFGIFIPSLEMEEEKE